VFYTKYFTKTLAVISCYFFFHKIYKYFLQKEFKTKLLGNMNFFCSDYSQAQNGPISMRFKCEIYLNINP